MGCPNHVLNYLRGSVATKLFISERGWICQAICSFSPAVTSSDWWCWICESLQNLTFSSSLLHSLMPTYHSSKRWSHYALDFFIRRFPLKLPKKCVRYALYCQSSSLSAIIKICYPQNLLLSFSALPAWHWMGSSTSINRNYPRLGLDRYLSEVSLAVTISRESTASDLFRLMLWEFLVWIVHEDCYHPLFHLKLTCFMACCFED